MEAFVIGGQELLHHRLRNSLNTISSILGLQINSLDTSKEKDPKKILKNSKQRIETIAMNYDSLCPNVKGGKVDFKQYVRDLTDMLNRFYCRNVSVCVQSSHVSLYTNKMFFIGVIVSELFTNSIKHGFKKDKNCNHVLISISEKEGRFLFVYHESPNESIDVQEILDSQTLGLRLVKLTAKQLNGTFDVIKNNGLMFIVSFT